MILSRSLTIALALAASLLASLPATAEMTLDPGTSVTFHHHDLLGSPVMVSDHKGRVLWYENTKPYGESLGKKSSSGLGHLDNTISESTSNLGYTGHTVDSSTGLVYMKARHYDPVVGRFYSNDPVAFKTSNPMMFNRYAYANNNPYLYIDPDGREGSSTTDEDNWDAAGIPMPSRRDVEAAKDIGETASEAVDVVDEQLTDPINYVPGAAATKSAGVTIGLYAKLKGWFRKADVPSPASKAESLALAKKLHSEQQLSAIANGEGVITHGAGTATPLNQAERLASAYGGNAADYQKISSFAVTVGGQHIETHAYRNSATNTIYEAKTIAFPQVTGVQ